MASPPFNRFVIADPRKCIGCYACIAACVESHRQVGLQAYPRLYVTHTPVGTMPMQCRHCENPSCAAVCPVQAITTHDGMVHLNESLCIGCKLCALACPFGAIIPGGTPIPGLQLSLGQYTYTHNPFESDPMFLRELSRFDQLSLLQWEIGRKTVAIKCDLCYFKASGPSCVQACPHKALTLIEPGGDLPPEIIEAMKAIQPFAAVEQEGVA